MDIQPPPPAVADEISGLTLTVVDPNGNSQFLGPFRTISNSSLWACYTPTIVGVYTFVLRYPGQAFDNGTIFYLPSQSTPITVNVTGFSSPTPNASSTPTPITTPPPESSPPVISSVTPISAACLQTIRIEGSGFGNTQPVIMNVGDGSIDTVGGGQGRPGSGGTPVIQIHDDNPASNPWQAGVQDSPSTGSCSIGIFLVSWSDNEIVLGGFGSALNPIPGQREWTILPGDAMRVVVITTGGTATYNTTVVSSGETPPTPTPNMLTPTFALSCQSSTTGSNFKVTIIGNLTCNSTALSGNPVLLSYSVNGGTSWNDLTLVDTDGNGNFLAVWTPLVTGSFLIKAAWTGNSTYSATAATVNLVVTPMDGQNVFSVTSNSTVSGFYFDSASRQLSFTVSGISGTTGFVDVYISKSVLTDISSLKVDLDRNPINFTSSSQGDSWLITFSYHHSTHEVSINLSSAPASQTSLNLVWQIAICGTAIAAVVITLSLIVKRNRKPATPA